MSNFQEYSKEYIEWKSWDSEEFGILSTRQRAYFSDELRRSGVDFSNMVNVLEIGFGNGFFLKFCREKGWPVVGLEVNPDLISAAKMAGYFVDFANRINELSGDRFDVVVAFDVLEHLSQSEIGGLFCEVRRILKPGGLFIARFPNGDSPLSMRYQNGDPTHLSWIGSETARYHAATTGFERIKIDRESNFLSLQCLGLTLRNMLLKPVFSSIEFVLKCIFHPRKRVLYCASNLVLSARKPK